jgi:threonine aldolase
MIVNLISDTVTKPSKLMLEAMLNADVGDDVYKDDPTVNFLENKVARMFNKSSALFFPSGTMTNQTAVKIHTQPGDELICDHFSHIYNYEGGGVSFNSGVTCKLINGDKGRINANEIEERINFSDFYHSPKTSLVCLENTTNKGGGTFYNFNKILKIKEVCKKHKLFLHLDGARLWNALVETRETTGDYGDAFDTISLCFSKGLGCPVGSILVGDEQTITKALRIRKVLGGGMRQSGYLAAAAIYALDNHRKELIFDHKKAKEIEKLLNKSPIIKNVEPVSTNIIIFSLIETLDENEFISKMKLNNILITSLGKNKLRIVTHRDYSDNQHDYFLSVFTKIKF